MPGTAYDTDRVLTVPNILSVVRLAGAPLFLWLVLGPRADVWAVMVLIVSGATDFLDGYLARSRHQVSRVGQMLDPIVDRTYIASTILGLALREVIPWWLVGVLVLRDVCMALLVPLLRTRGYTSLPVHFLGKVATFCLLYAFPAVLLGTDSFAGSILFKVSGWAFLIWGAGLYWWAGLLYVRQAVALAREPKSLP